MSMLEFPTFEEMVRVMNSPSAPPSPMDSVDYLNSTEAEMELSTDEMIRQMFGMMKAMHDTANNTSASNDLMNQMSDVIMGDM